MLNRVGNGAAVAALPLAAAIAAFTGDCMLFTAIFGALTGVVMFVACAPWLPVVRNLLPGRRRVAALESLLLEGSRLEARSVSSDDEYAAWQATWQDWQRAVMARLSTWDAQSVIHTRVISYAIRGSFHKEHEGCRNALGHQIRALEAVLDREPDWARIP